MLFKNASNNTASVKVAVQAGYKRQQILPGLETLVEGLKMIEIEGDDIPCISMHQKGMQGKTCNESGRAAGRVHVIQPLISQYPKGMTAT